MEHKVIPAYKIFEEISSDKIEKQVNDFSRFHEIESVDIKIQQRSQKGMMLCERLPPFTDICNVYLATVKYKRDITKELVDKNLIKWAWKTVENEFKKLGGGYCNLNTLEWTSKSDVIKQKVEQLLVSDEAKAMRVTLENKFCREALEAITPDKKGDEGQCKNS